MRAVIATILMISMILIPGFSGAVEDKGAEDMVLEGGKKGEVPFPHRMHQIALEDDCMACHDIFDKKKGSITRLEKEGALKNKQVMNTKCVRCHKKLKKAKKAHGPIKCAKCHIKKK